MPKLTQLWSVLSTNKKVKETPLQITNAPSSGSSRDPKKSIIKRIGLAFTTGGGTRATLEGPEGFDLAEIEKAYNTEAYVRQAIDKYIDFIFKAGWDIIGKNQNSVDYIKLRLAAMAEATKTPTKQLFIEMAEDLVLYHNVFVVKARASGSYTLPQGINATGLGGGKPVVGYFTLPVTTITIARQSNGTINAYQQTIAGSAQPLDIKPDDMIHMFIDKPKGRAFGVPFLWQVLDDIKLLRQIEELIARLIYKDIFPLYQYQVGLAKEGYEATDEEIEYTKEQISTLTLDGGIVVPERHNISVIGSQGKALDAYQYLKYFEQRVFTGLGVSETMMGRGDSANRSTADNMTTDMHDRIKAYQSQMAMFIDELIFNELLREGGFDPLLRPEDAVHFQFKEIDLDNKIKAENQAIQKFTNNAITHEELRMEIGMDPVTDEGRLYFNMITASLAQAKAAANSVDNLAQPENQNGKKLSPKKESVTESLHLEESLRVKEISKHDDYVKDLRYHWENAREDIINLVRQYYLTREKASDGLQPKEIEGVLWLTRDSMSKLAEKYIRMAFNTGVQDAKAQSGTWKEVNVNYLAGVKELMTSNSGCIDKLLNEDLTKLVSSALQSSDEADAISKVVGAFTALNYRLEFIAKSEIYTSYNYGFAKACMALGYTEAFISQGDIGCQTCSSLAGTKVQLSMDLSNIPPFHPNCTCTLVLTNPQGKEGLR
jgi:hypothetical protein